MGFLNGKRALITGLASDRSIAWGIAQAMGREGAELALTYQNEKLKPRVDKFAQSLGSTVVLPCDVGTDSAIDSLFDELAKHWDTLDILVHSIAFAPREELEGLEPEGCEAELGFRGSSGNIRILIDVSCFV